MNAPSALPRDRSTSSWRRTQRSLRGWTAAVAGAMLLALALPAFLTSASVGLTRGASPQSTPIIHWDASNIYPGQNNNLPWGPVGTRVTVHGSQFPVIQALQIVLVRGNSNSVPGVCQNAPVGVGGTAVNANGAFSLTFNWPASAGQVNASYSVCSFEGMNGGVQSTADDGPFTVLAGSPPLLTVSPTDNVRPGTVVTISGRNWVPPQPVSVTIDAAGGGPRLVAGTATSQGLSAGTFSLTLTIPSNAAKGDYFVNASAQNGNLTTYDPLPISVIAAAPTPTPTHAPTPTPTHAPTVVPTHVPTHVPTSAPTSVPTTAPNVTPVTTTNGPDWLVIGLAVIAGLALLTLVAFGVLLLARRNRPPQPAGQPYPLAPGAPYGGPTYPAAMPYRQDPYGPPGYGYPPAPGSQGGAHGQTREPASPPAQYPQAYGQYPAGPGEYPPPEAGGYPAPDEPRAPMRYPRYEPRSHPVPGTRTPGSTPYAYPSRPPSGAPQEGNAQPEGPQTGTPPYPEGEPPRERQQ